MSLTGEQKALRRTGIGGSEIAAIVGQDPYRTALDIWLAKVDGYEQPDSAAMERGRFLEDGVARWYAHRTGAELREVGTIRHPTRSLALCTPDRLATVRNPESGASLTLDVSIKVPGPYVREQWGEAWTDDFPRPYLLQIQWELAILRAREECFAGGAHLAAPIDGDLRVYEAGADEELQGLLMDEAERFWRDHVETRRPPDIDGSESCTAWLERRFPRSSGPMLRADARGEVLALALQEAEGHERAAGVVREAATNRLKDLIGEADGIEGAFGKVTWRTNKKGVRSFRTNWRRQ